jgi:hypothetical protein
VKMERMEISEPIDELNEVAGQLSNSGLGF